MNNMKMQFKKWTREVMAEGHRDWFHYPDENKKGETILVEMSYGYDRTKQFKEYKKHGFTDKVLDTAIFVSTYVRKAPDKHGFRDCYMGYNPAHKPSDDGKRWVINFDWTFEVSEENIQRLLDEIERRFLEGER